MVAWGPSGSNTTRSAFWFSWQPTSIFSTLILMQSSAGPGRAPKALCSMPLPPPPHQKASCPIGLWRHIKAVFSLSTQSVSQERAWPGWGDLRKLDDFPASHESGVHGLILLFKVNSWNITRFLISMQKHFQCQVVSFGVISTDPPGSLLFRRREMGWERQASIRFCRAFGALVRSLDFEQWKVIRGFKQLQAMIWYSFIKDVSVDSVANGMERMRAGGHWWGGSWNIHSLIYPFILQICAATLPYSNSKGTRHWRQASLHSWSVRGRKTMKT